MPDPGELAARLRRWTAGHDPHVRAAVELLIADGFWLRHDGFAGPGGAVRCDGGEAWIGWDKARQVHDAGGASMTQLAVLRLAIAIGTDEYRLSRMSYGQAEIIMHAVAAALVLKAEVSDA